MLYLERQFEERDHNLSQNYKGTFVHYRDNQNHK